MNNYLTVNFADFASSYVIEKGKQKTNKGIKGETGDEKRRKKKKILSIFRNNKKNYLTTKQLFAIKKQRQQARKMEM